MAYYRRIRDMREDHDLTQRQLAALPNAPSIPRLYSTPNPTNTTTLATG